MCGDSHLPPAPESADLVAIIHPVYSAQNSSRPASSGSTSTSSSTSSSVSPSRSSSPSLPGPVSGRLRLSNSTGVTRSEFSTFSQPALPGLYDDLSVRIHKYGAGDDNPVTHCFGMVQPGSGNGMKLDLGVGGDGVVGRAVSIVDFDGRVLGEGILGRI